MAEFKILFRCDNCGNATRIDGEAGETPGKEITVDECYVCEDEPAELTATAA